MDVTKIIDPLNDAQRQAVAANPTAMLILAGAGSGKTRVLVHRIAWLIQVENAMPHNILAVTFTNKAAREMQGRFEALLNYAARGMWIGTFHGIAHRLLRRHSDEADLPPTFQILDSDDQYRLIRRILKSLNLDEARWPPRQAQWFINHQKDEGKRAKHIVESADLFQRTQLQIYSTYEQICQRSGLVDFAELLLRAHELLRDDTAMLDHYKQRFLHVLVDEFQDTNTIQYAWLRLLTEDQNNLFVVGDDDQSIYGWRGAKMEHIYQFRKDYPDHQLIRLEQNYRSTGNILNAANALIANNQERMGKKLWTNDGEGEPIYLYSAFNEQDEAVFVVDKIRQWIDEGNGRAECAILYRSNAQSRLFEERLVAAGIPYRVYGGLRFFDRAEIKNAIAYLRIIANRDDDTSMERVVNFPPRGIGPRTLEEIRERSRQDTCSLWQASLKIVDERALSARATNALLAFVNLINALADAINGMSLTQQIAETIDKSGLIAHYKQEKGEKGEARVENLEELVNAGRQFDFRDNEDENDEETPESIPDPMDEFLAHAALEAGEDQAEAFEDSVQLMTLHSAKGLEFKLVFIAGLEEGLFPSKQSIEEPTRLEEERRLCYVGMTRAMQQLYLTHAECRRLYGKENYPRVSRFVREIPSPQIQEIRLRGTVTRPVMMNTSTTPATGDGHPQFSLGERVFHNKYGEGIVLKNEGEGSRAQVQVNFENGGSKWLMVAYANLQTL